MSASVLSKSTGMSIFLELVSLEAVLNLSTHMNYHNKSSKSKIIPEVNDPDILYVGFVLGHGGDAVQMLD